MEVAARQRVNEMEFYYPLARITPQGLALQFRSSAGAMPVSSLSFAEAAGRLQFSPVQGFMKGYIDLIFEHQGRFYLADYKSNHLGFTVHDYSQEALAAVMSREQYFLQYHLYGVALHRYLTARLPGYAYDQHFGGVYYLFVRGMHPTLGLECGVFFDRPAASAIVGLSAYLAGRAQETG
jgi:exodeoxyribonuclease V beta subunit